jgi:hypothetical protein
MNSTPTVLVYDDALETSEVLEAVYQPRGFEVRRLTSGEEWAGGLDGGAVVVLSSPAGESTSGSPPLKVMIGRFSEEPSQTDTSRVVACRLSSLFDYRELVSAIDRLLCETS